MKSFNPSKVQGFVCVCFIIHQVSESFLSFWQLFRQAVEKALLNTYVKKEAVKNEAYKLVNC